MDMIEITLKGKTMGEILTAARSIVDEIDQLQASASKAGASTTTAPKAKRKPPTATVETADDLDLDLAGDEDDLASEPANAAYDELSFDEETEEEAPKAKKTKAAPAPKIGDVNDAAKAHAKKNGREKTLAILTKKFKVKSVSELKPEQYAEVIKALAI